MKTQDLVIKTFDEEIERLEKTLFHLKTDWRQKLERRVRSDYAGKEQKLRSIGKDIVEVREQLEEAIRRLKSNVG